jgi:hypothetical protein
MIAGAAYAVSPDLHAKGTPHPATVARAGINEGAQNNKAAISTVLTILRSFIVAPCHYQSLNQSLTSNGHLLNAMPQFQLLTIMNEREMIPFKKTLFRSFS